MVYITRYLDLFWTNPTSNLYNTSFKVVFIASQTYIVYLMLNDYKPTHDPNQDTFKVEYLVGGAAVLGLLFPYRYVPSEVCASRAESQSVERGMNCVRTGLTEVL